MGDQAEIVPHPSVAGTIPPLLNRLGLLDLGIGLVTISPDKSLISSLTDDVIRLHYAGSHE